MRLGMNAHSHTPLWRERQGQEVCGLIERAHGATVTLNVQGFIRVLERRRKTWLCYTWFNLFESKHMENIQFGEYYSLTTVAKHKNNYVTSRFDLEFWVESKFSVWKYLTDIQSVFLCLPFFISPLSISLFFLLNFAVLGDSLTSSAP